MATYEFPEFDQLPPVPGQPQGSLWGFFDRGAEKDELGSEFLVTNSISQLWLLTAI